MPTIKHIYLADFGTFNGKPYYVFVEKEDNIAEEEDEIVIGLGGDCNE